MSKFMITPESSTEPFIELSRTKKGRLFKKHILSLGPLFANGKQYDVDEEFMSELVNNFHSKACDIVQVPIVGKDNQHSEDPRDNIGEVVDLKFEDGKLYSFIDSRKAEASEELGNTMIGASAMISPDYLDTKTHTRVGPTLLHVAVTNRPHVLELEDFEEVISASAVEADDVVLLTQQDTSGSGAKTEPEEKDMKIEELLALLKTEHSIDVEALQAELAEKQDLQTQLEAVTVERDTLQATAESNEDLAVKLSNAVVTSFKLDEVINLSASEGTNSQAEALIGAVADAGAKLEAQNSEIVSLSGRITSLEDDKKQVAAESAVESLVASGHILPVNRDAMVELRLSNPEIFDKIIPEAPVVELSAENGTSAGSDDPTAQDFASAEVARLTAIK